MKKQKIWQLCFIFSLLSVTLAQAAQVSNIQNAINPIVDLRAPRSLFEVLHNGINTIYVSLESCSNSYDTLVDTVHFVQGLFNQLLSDYDAMVNTTRNHQVYNSDKEFLQKMIDRINSLIDKLEHKESNGADQETQDALRVVRSFCDALKAKISF